MDVGDVRREPPYLPTAGLIGWLTGEPWILAAGEYAFYNGGAWLGDVSSARLVEIAYFLLHRKTVGGIAKKEVVNAREKAERSVDNAIHDTEVNDDGLPSWVGASGIKPADWKPGDDDWGSPFG
jgi:hypothetical protein